MKLDHVPLIKTTRGPCYLTMEDGSVWTWERTIVRVNRWRRFGLGVANWGFVNLGTPQLVRVTP